MLKLAEEILKSLNSMNKYRQSQMRAERSSLVWKELGVTPNLFP